MLLKVLSFVTLVTAVTSHGDFGHPTISLENIFDYDLYERVLDAELCEIHLREMSSLEFYDASFRLPQGILDGNYLNYGNYFQCLSIRQESTEGDIEGKHCMIRFPQDASTEVPMLPRTLEGPTFREWNSRREATADTLKRDTVGLDANLLGGMFDSRTSAAITELLPLLHLGVCIPKTCTVEQALEQYFNGTNLTVEYEEQHCRLPDDKPWMPVDTVALVIIAIIVILTQASTGYELYHIFIATGDPKAVSRLLSCFSLYSNTDRLFTFRPNPGALESLDGIRSLSIMWIIAGHSLLTMVMGGLTNVPDLAEWYSTLQATYIKAANLSVDTFFLLSGLLLVYTNASKQTQTGLIKNLHLYYLNRVLRLFPILAAAVLLQASLVHRVDDGPNWHFEGTYVKLCRDYWWAALLYIQNYYNPEESCLPHTWYLSVDIQLYLISPLVLFFVLGGRRAGWAGVTGGVLVSLTVSTMYVFLVVAGVSVPGTSNYVHYYSNTLTRAPPFFIGMMLGFLLHVYKKQNVVLSKWLVAFNWTAALVSSAVVFYAFYAVFLPSFDSEALNSLHNSFSRSIWAGALGWLIFACVHGYGGPINWFLSLTVWKFVARISYAMYMVHTPIQYIGVATTLTPTFFSPKNHLVRVLTDLCLTVIVSVLLCIIIEAPLSTLQSMYVGSGSKKPPPKAAATKATTTDKDAIAEVEPDTAGRSLKTSL